MFFCFSLNSTYESFISRVKSIKEELLGKISNSRRHKYPMSRFLNFQFIHDRDVKWRMLGQFPKFIKNQICMIFHMYLQSFSFANSRKKINKKLKVRGFINNSCDASLILKIAGFLLLKMKLINCRWMILKSFKRYVHQNSLKNDTILFEKLKFIHGIILRHSLHAHAAS